MAVEGNLGKWSRWYALPGADHPYGSEETYQLGADFLKPCALVEDWGCGFGWMARYVSTAYHGIDGSWTPATTFVADLVDYRSNVPGIFIRHVLEHDYRWRQILENAVASFTERLVLVLFTPLQDETREIAWAEDPSVPDLGFAFADVVGFFEGLEWRHESLRTATQYGVETIFYVERVV